ncbi:MAG: GIY-YIG nuclease family protein [Thermodesulfobacteriota bacterium]|nr:GIY-YIG nuclease family protein [Thermodesulfobacteriota bacterium]
MNSDKFFPLRTGSNPTIYAYEDTNPQYEGLLKVGYTTVDAQSRVAQQYPTKKPGKPPYRIVFEESAMRNDGTAFTDHDIHRFLRSRGVKNPEGEWFRCSVEQVKEAVIAVRTGEMSEESRSLDFTMRPEQKAAVEKTAAYFKSAHKDAPDKTPHFLWNAKMRFGKTFTAYQLVKKMKWRKVLVLTFKPAVQSAWEEDLKCHIDFKGWQFISPRGLSYEKANKKKPIVCFGSFQDYLGKNTSTGGIKTKNEWVHATNWDCVIFDEYHYGAWRENAKELFEAEDKKEREFGEGEGLDYYDEEIMPITTDAYLYLSGTPFRAIASGEFIEEQIFNWTYSDEQGAKQKWEGEDNPYSCLPRMVLMTYQIPDAIREIAMQGEFDEFDLNIFFSAEGKYENAKFTYEDEVQKWLDLIRGAFQATTIDNLKLGAKKPPMPFSDVRLLNVLSHTFWFLPSVASCYAMRKLLGKKQNRFYRDYQVIVAAGSAAGIGVDALPPVQDAMDDPLQTKTITLSCGKLTTGVTVRPWTGIFMLRNSSSPETYFQAAFRVQNPWVVMNPDGDAPNHEEIIKKECYVFDFAPDRALRQIADYSCRLNLDESNPEKKVEEFISFLPVLAYDGSSMKQIDAAGILDIAMSGTSATLLARRWESALLVNVDNTTLQRLMNSEAAMKALMSIEGFRNLNQDIETIINKSDAVKKARKEKNDEELTKKERKEMTEEEKEYKSKRKIIQEKLIKFATRVPVFMYLTDYRERCLKDVITQLEPGLFKSVTGLKVKDFELLVSLGVFNSALMNDAVYKFKRYEDASLIYIGINKHEGADVGLFDTVLSTEDYRKTFENVVEKGG